MRYRNTSIKSICDKTALTVKRSEKENQINKIAE